MKHQFIILPLLLCAFLSFSDAAFAQNKVKVPTCLSVLTRAMAGKDVPANLVEPFQTQYARWYRAYIILGEDEKSLKTTNEYYSLPFVDVTKEVQDCMANDPATYINMLPAAAGLPEDRSTRVGICYNLMAHNEKMEPGDPIRKKLAAYFLALAYLVERPEDSGNNITEAAKFIDPTTKYPFNDAEQHCNHVLAHVINKF